MEGHLPGRYAECRTLRKEQWACEGFGELQWEPLRHGEARGDSHPHAADRPAVGGGPRWRQVDIARSPAPAGRASAGECYVVLAERRWSRGGWCHSTPHLCIDYW